MVQTVTQRVVWGGESGYDVIFVVGEIPRSAQLRAMKIIVDFRESIDAGEKDLDRREQDALLRQLDMLCVMESTKSIYVIKHGDLEDNKIRITSDNSPIPITMGEDSVYKLRYPPTQDMLDGMPLSILEEWLGVASKLNAPFVRWLFPSLPRKPETNTTGR